MIKVYFILEGWEEVRDYGNDIGAVQLEADNKLENAIYDKVLRHPVMLPYTPTKGMSVNTRAFYDVWGLDEHEIEYLDGTLYFINISMIAMVPDGLEVYVTWH